MNLLKIRRAIAECFASDRDLIERFHIAAGEGLEACIERTMQDVSKFHSTFKFFEVRDEDGLAGYFGTEYGTYLNLIFVKPDRRNKEFMSRFWKIIESELSNPFYTAVYKKNKPANQFYLKMGKKIKEIENEGHRAVIFAFNRS